MTTSAIIDRLRCPLDGQRLIASDDGQWLVTADGTRRYPVEDGIARLLPEYAQDIPAQGTSAQSIIAQGDA
ncbi:MAG: hypothetical protein Q4D61_06570 [Cardiobacteriaceae bacterium]|nr:hypothetical protein [Cardiobacteriaceae bacterium]